jgi:hypothetical protein
MPRRASRGNAMTTTILIGDDAGIYSRIDKEKNRKA